MKPDEEAPAEDLPPLIIDRSLAFQRPATAKAHAYWLSRKGARKMPPRADISPAGLRDILPMIVLVDIPRAGGDDSVYAIRLAGDAIQRVFGPITGGPLKDILPPEIFRRWIFGFDIVRAETTPIRVTSRVAYQNKSWLQAEMLLAPLGEGDEISMIFAAADIWPADDA